MICVFFCNIATRAGGTLSIIVNRRLHYFREDEEGEHKYGYFVYKFFFSYPVYNVGHCYDIGDTNNARNQNDAFRKILFRDRYTRSMAFSKPTFLWFTFSRMLSNLTDCRLCIMFFIYKATFNFLK